MTWDQQAPVFPSHPFLEGLLLQDDLSACPRQSDFVRDKAGFLLPWPASAILRHHQVHP